MNRRGLEYEKKKSEWCDKIEKLIEELEQLRKEHKDTTNITLRLETVLEDFFLFRRESGR